MSDIKPPEGDQFESDWLPIYDARTPYNEDKIVALLHEFERLYLKLSPVPPDQIAWAPEGGHRINESLCRKMGVNSTVISLLRRLTYDNAHTWGGIHMENWATCVDYRVDAHIRGSRHVEGIPPFDTPEGYVKMLPQEVILGMGGIAANNIILDTAENTIRLVHGYHTIEEMNPPWYTALEYPGEDHYRNYYPRHAPTYLRMLIQKVRFLDLIPVGSEAEQEIFLSNHIYPWMWQRRKIRHILIGTYGWPDSFNEERYREERQELWTRVWEEYRNLGEPRLV